MHIWANHWASEHRAQQRIELVRGEHIRAFRSMSSQKFEEYAQRCSELARQADTPERSERLLKMAQEYMRAAKDLGTGEAPNQPRLQSSFPSIRKTLTYDVSNALDTAISYEERTPLDEGP
jgi:hypothetical protein